jgi:hypothetical protein
MLESRIAANRGEFCRGAANRGVSYMLESRSPAKRGEFYKGAGQ